MKHSTLGTRMKQYEAASQYYLTNRMPVVLRLDGCHFHTFTRGLDKPFDKVLNTAMQYTMHDLCKNIQGCVFGYTQSDEITLILIDYQNLETTPWFGNRVQKISSVAASMASRFFNKHFREISIHYSEQDCWDAEKMSRIQKKFDTADFDCRVFNVPKEDVCNCILWRQQDATRNSIQSLAQSLYSHKQLRGISCKELQNKMFTEKGINWNDLPIDRKRGCACYNDEKLGWIIDLKMPILTEDRAYVERHVCI